MLRIALGTLRARTGGFVGAFLALFCAAALVSACGLLMQTGIAGEIPTERYAAAPVLVAGDRYAHWTTQDADGDVKTKSKEISEQPALPAAVADRLRDVPGVGSVIPELTFPAYLVGPDQRPVSGPGGRRSWGHGWDSAALAPFTLREGRAPASGEIVVDGELAARAGLAVGASVTVQAGDAPARYRVAGIAAPPATGTSQQSSVFFAAEQARRLFGRDGQVSAIGVLPVAGTELEPLRERIDTALAGTMAKAYLGAERGPLEFPEASSGQAMLISVSGTVGGTSLMIAILVVVGTFALSIQQRHREIALLRAVAATPRQVRRMLGGEALAVGVVAGALGSVAGIAVAGWLRGRFVAMGALPETVALDIGPIPILAAAAVTLLAAWVAAVVAARRAIRIRPTEALAEAALEPPRLGWGRVIAGLVFLAGTAALVVLLSSLSAEPASTPVAMAATVFGATAVSLLGPVLAKGAVAVLGLPVGGLARAAGYLAVANSRAGARRMGSVIAPMSMAIALACTGIFMQTTMAATAQQRATDGIVADYLVTAAGPGVSTAGAQALRQLPGVTAVTELLHTKVRIDQAKYSAQAVNPEGLSRTLDLQPRSGSLDRLRGQSVALSTAAAQDLGAKLGDRLELRLGDGTPVTPEVVALYDRGARFGSTLADVTLPRELVAAHVTNPFSDTVLVAAAPAARAAVAEAASRIPGGALSDRSGFQARQSVQSSRNAEVFYLIIGLVVGFAAIAVANTTTMSTLDRSREFALLRLVGTTRRQVLGMMRWESALAVLVAAVLGTGIAFAVLSGFSAGLTDSALPTVPPLVYLAIVASVALLGFASAALPARFVLRGNPADTISVRG